MKSLIPRLIRTTRKGIVVLKDDGLTNFSKRALKYSYYKVLPERKKKVAKDILFINGCGLPHPARYRVSHQIEQLESAGLTADSVFYETLDMEMIKYYRGFVFFRCPITDTVREFINVAKQYNKTCFFDIDDLVIDQKYTDKIKYVSHMPKEEKELYDDGVNRMRATMELCDHIITTTTQLQKELKNYTKGEVFINRNVASDEMGYLSNQAVKNQIKSDDRLVIGYFSGSITHNEDFNLVLPSLVRLMQKHQNLYLKVVGILDIPSELEPYKDRVINVSFMDWKKLPLELAECDINIAPLVNTIFNCAKSENKWVEASLVKVPTVASDVGAFAEIIEHGVTGILANEDNWYSTLDDLIKDSNKRTGIGQKAFDVVTKLHTTVYTSNILATFIRGKLARNIGIALPTTDISGGVIVALKHADILRGAGWDVTMIDTATRQLVKKAKKEYNYRDDIPGYNLLSAYKTDFKMFFDTQVATLWTTLKFIKEYANVKNRIYFVQNYETDFYSIGDGESRFLANASYSDQTSVRYVTMSIWCCQWLKDKFNKDARYSSNGIDLDRYKFKKRDFEGRIKILVEGDSKSEYKNVDEAFRIIENLDPAKYEISYLSYRKEPKNWYRVDHFYNRIPPEEVGEVYGSCDILIKTSILESFSYPPLEMMATGGVSVVVPNDGNIEYLRDGENCLFYRQGDIEAGVAAVNRIVSDKILREKLIRSGRETAERYSWDTLTRDVLSLYE